ncbi:Lon protease family protein [Pseudohaliea rubra]|uniref:endopeptidase La n=1 Tax=Pseudohaliea rubra DSM 19751 TaxID=1265313 RepID=A0A095VMI1_9GAMM|nr:ATP-binding protein [Pseudohaliea rubra]KGE02667.1 ATP-dependent protease LaType II [Pseudohaliea rubra DSM 19751]
MTDSLRERAPAPAAEPLPADALYRSCPLEPLGFDSTAELEPLAFELGQERALEALDFGLAVDGHGFNIFLAGSTGSGRRELLQGLLERQRAARAEAPEDWCYVNNFDDPGKPLALRLPPGRGRQLRSAMAEAVEELLTILPATFQGDEYQTRVQELGEHFQERESEAFQALAEKASEQGVAMLKTPSGYTLAPLKDGEVLAPAAFEKLPEAERKATLEAIDRLKEELKSVVRQLPGWKKESLDRFRELNSDFCRQAVAPVFERLRADYRDLPAVLAWLATVEAAAMEEAESFTQQREDSAIPDNLHQRVREFPQYSINVLIDHADSDGPPVVHEDNPTFANLLGRAEQVAKMGTLVTDFTMVKAGALHRANGGYLVLEAEKVLSSPFAWTALKRTLRAREIRIQSLDQAFSFATTVQLEPEPIPLAVKVILLGDYLTWFLLQEYDPEFATLFKITADMAPDVARSQDSTRLFARLLATVQRRDGLLPIERDGVARCVELAARLTGDGGRLDLHQGRLGKLLAEADFLARRAGAEAVRAEHVSAAVAAADRRLGQWQERAREQILRERTLVATDGDAVGQVNGLAVHALGEYRFGLPTRITATARLGSGKVLDIEREVDLGGKVHSKAVLIISALLANRWARERPLPLAATLVFEQSYGGIEGDSASVAELAALVSAIAEVPLRQDLAVTGSLNQHGAVQPIGGINEKIEGFFDLCAARGLSGSQGVVMPAANRDHLMLADRVRAAVDDGRFHVYAVASVDEALALLTGVAGGALDAAMDERIDALLARARYYARNSPGEQDDD